MTDGESGEFWYAYHAYHENGLLPSVFANLEKEERAILMAFIDLKIEAEEKAQKKMKRR